MEIADKFPAQYIRYYRGIQSYRNKVPPPTKQNRQIHLHFGPPGCGKSHYSKTGPTGRLGIIGVDFWMPALGDPRWFDHYDGQTRIILDDFDGARSRTTLRNVLNLLDCWNGFLPTKGGFTFHRCWSVHITTNYHPLDWYDWAERQPQYGSICRRFTHLHWWQSPDRASRLDIKPGSPLWDRFWDGPVLSSPLYIATDWEWYRRPTPVTQASVSS